MSEIEKAQSQNDLLYKSIENANNSIKLLNHYIVKNESLQVENIKNQVYIALLKKQIEDLSHEIKANYSDDKVLITKVSKILDSPDMQKASDTIAEIRMAMHLMKLVAANITSFDGDPEIWYKYTDSIKRMESKINYLP